MEQQIKCFLADDALVELEDAYVDKQKDLRSEINQQIKILCKSAKMTKLHKTILVNRKQDDENSGERIMKQDNVPLKEVDLSKYDVAHDPAWIPEKMDKETTKAYVQKVGDKTWKYLLEFAKLYCARIDLYNASLTDKEEKEKATQPKCFEEIMHEQLINALNGIIAKNIDAEFDAEFDEIEKADEKPKLAGERDKPKK